MILTPAQHRTQTATALAAGAALLPQGFGPAPTPTLLAVSMARWPMRGATDLHRATDFHRT